MTAPNMAAITASLECSFHNYSLNHHHHNTAAATERSSSSDETDAPDHRRHQQQRQNPHLSALHSPSSSNNNNYDAAVELNSHVSLPYHWEQCLDLKTGEVYYINWRNGMRANEDPRIAQGYMNGEYYYSDEDDDEDGSSSYNSDESSSESSPSSSRDHYNNSSKVEKEGNNNVLVVDGCQRCLMYFMVPKQVEDCPKCSGRLLHFDRSDSNGSP
ncbi:unnamed protein product [Linum tenue]|uniref:GIR1-like zinc ribbon domain-containing protein n=1 Tax=Linum tenue TaxID=586396 RepID=A0AAV0H7X0_9ROSI|nr:unnamed protein product [Linum tenue]